jgi:hypothetical protein
MQGAGGTEADLGGQGFQGIPKLPGSLPGRRKGRSGLGKGLRTGSGIERGIVREDPGIPGFPIAVPEVILGGVEKQGKRGFFFSGHSSIEP